MKFAARLQVALQPLLPAPAPRNVSAETTFYGARDE